MIKLNEVLPHLSIPNCVTVDLTPKDYQIEDVLKLIHWKRSSCFSEVGTGKSLISYLWIMEKLYSEKGVIVVMPPSLLTQYVRNFSVVKGHDFTIEILAKDKTKREKLMEAWVNQSAFPDVLCMSYQLFVKYAKWLRGVKRYRAIVADEAHILANAPTSFFQNMFMMVYSRDMDFLEMTATPCPTELRSAYGHIRLKYPDAYMDMAHFDRVHTIWVPKIETGGQDIVAGYRDLDKLNYNLNYHAIRRRQDEVLSLKAPTVVEHHIDLGDEHLALYQQLLLERMLELGDELLVAKNQQALRQMALQIVTNVNEFTDKRIENVPLDNLIEIVNAVPGKVAIFCHFRITVLMLAKAFAKRNPALVYGGSNVQANVDKFLNDETCTVAILNYQSGGAGINLQSVCNHAVFYEATGSPGMLEQALGRIQRLGQKHPVVAWVFGYAFTSSNKLFQKAYGRSADIKIVMDDSSVFIDHLKKELRIL